MKQGHIFADDEVGEIRRILQESEERVREFFEERRRAAEVAARLRRHNRQERQRRQREAAAVREGEGA